MSVRHWESVLQTSAVGSPPQAVDGRELLAVVDQQLRYQVEMTAVRQFGGVAQWFCLPSKAEGKHSHGSKGER